jgi:hypothetical protein
MGRAFGLLIFLFISNFASAASLSQTDVSILFPLPTGPVDNFLFEGTTRGAFGELLPRAVYDRMPTLGFESADATFQKLRVVGLRMDPCFVKPAPAVGCQAQVRMVWQPVELYSTKWFAGDIAVHTFYDLPEADFSRLVTRLEKLKSDYGSTVLDEVLTVNPLLKRFGLESAYAKELFAILLTQVGAKHLSQATFTQLSGSGNVWVFGGFIVNGTQITELPIPRIAGPTQTFANNPSLLSPTYFQFGSMSPEPRGADTFNLLIRDSRSISPADEPEVVESTMSAIRVENPKNHNASTMDCVSCHTAQAARIWATRQFPWLYLDPRGNQMRFQSKFDLTNESLNQDHTKIVRNFGYDAVNPAISQRTINETAAVLERLYPDPKSVMHTH